MRSVFVVWERNFLSWKAEIGKHSKPSDLHGELSSLLPRSSLCHFSPQPNPRRVLCVPATMDQPSAEIEGVLRTIPLDHSLLVLNPDTETFFKAETGIQDTEKLREHIIEVQKEAFKVSLCV